jgi:hypothetical protein
VILHRFLLYKTHGPVIPQPNEPQVPAIPYRSLCFLWFSRGETGQKLELFLDAAGVYWAKRVT